MDYESGVRNRLLPLAGLMPNHEAVNFGRPFSDRLSVRADDIGSLEKLTRLVSSSRLTLSRWQDVTFSVGEGLRMNKSCYLSHGVVS